MIILSVDMLTTIDYATRELREETGVEASEIKEIGRVVNDIHHSLYVEYLCITDCEKDESNFRKAKR